MGPGGLSVTVAQKRKNAKNTNKLFGISSNRHSARSLT